MDRINWCRPFHARSDRHAPKGSAVVSVEPGLLLRDLIQALAARGLTLPSLPMLLDQTIGGMFAQSFPDKCIFQFVRLAFDLYMNFSVS